MNTTFDYKTTEMIRGLMLGGHKSRQRGTGADFYKKSLFMDEPDTSRIDLNASLTDPFESLHVKSFRQRSKLDVLVLIDGSSSMLFDNKMQITASIFDSIKASVAAANDRFTGFLLNQHCKRISDIDDLTQALSVLVPEDNSAQGTQQLYQHLPNKPSLVFVVSDFHWPDSQLQSLMTQLSSHLVVPIIVWQSKEYLDFPLWRFVELTDLESGASSLVFVTKHQQQLIAKQYQQRQTDLTALFRRFNQRPFWLLDAFEPLAMSRYFSTL
ncbi:MAG TPA: hypothetical protein ENI26_01790 [Methylophaga aminisulfidivorans]|uniref:DUF58 domain-containing protein n=1 Tax=Methylophaga aminisulfidivorans TaxID=230105 RepID=A0A7C1VYE1_9GAMM|nr:hypothetical protein [Methylophaga aminisulfidivorans]